MYLNRAWQKYCDYSCQQAFHRKQYRKVKDWYRQEQAEKQRVLQVQQRSEA
jgi:hypothetical protein